MAKKDKITALKRFYMYSTPLFVLFGLAFLTLITMKKGQIVLENDIYLLLLVAFGLAGSGLKYNIQLKDKPFKKFEGPRILVPLLILMFLSLLLIKGGYRWICLVIYSGFFTAYYAAASLWWFIKAKEELKEGKGKRK